MKSRIYRVLEATANQSSSIRLKQIILTFKGMDPTSDPVSRSPTPNATKTVDPPRRPSIFTVGSVASMNELDDTSSSAVSLSNVASSADLDCAGYYSTPYIFSSVISSSCKEYATSGARPKPGIGATEGSWHSGSDITTTLLRPQKRGLSGLSSGDNEGKGCGIVVFVKDIRDMLPVSANLAKDYTLMGTDPVAICSANSVIASTHNRNDLAKLWTIAGLILARVSGVSGPSIGGDPDYDSDEDSVATADFGGSAKPAIVLAPAAPSFGSKRRQTAALLSRLQGDPKGFHQNAKDSLELKKDGTVWHHKRCC
ncbi:hypothetical protein BDR26DRAFT_890876 [Obelidium mucronatum]|nr:hypothetical protein BDR26DRAFT_890876 [Obelidium mucronatum]